MSVQCANCGSVEFEKKEVVVITETRMRFKMSMELEYEQTEFRYYCTICSTEYLGLYGP